MEWKRETFLCTLFFVVEGKRKNQIQLNIKDFSPFTE